MPNEIKEILDLFYNEYPKEEKILEKYITNLQQRIDKAVEYITHEHFKRDQIGITNLSFDENELNVLLNILRGDE